MATTRNAQSGAGRGQTVGTVSSMTSKMQSLRMGDKSEKNLLVRIAVLVDALANAQRGPANAPNSISRKANTNNLNKPKLLTGSTQNIFNGASVKIDPPNSANNLSHYEVQLDSNSNFSDPTTKEIFTGGTTFKGLTNATEYNIRIRPITKNGQIGEWALLETITTTPAGTTADFDGDNLGATAVSKTFSFDNTAQDLFCITNGGNQDVISEAPMPVGVANGNIRNDTEEETDVSYEARRIGGVSGTTIEEIVTLDGIAPTPVSTFTGKNANEGAYANMEIIRFKPLVLFNLMEANSADSFPADYTFDVLIDIAGGGFTPSTEDTVWVKF